MTSTLWTERPERGSARSLKLMFAVARIVGRPTARLLLWPIAVFFWLRTPAARADSRNYLNRVLDRPATWRDTYQHYWAFSATILDRIYFLSGQHELFDIDVHGDHHLEKIIKQGNGLFLVGAHLGSFEVLRTMAHQQPDLRVSMAMFEENARKISSVLNAVAPDRADDIITLGKVDSMIKLSKRLERGDAVGLLADRSFSAGDTLDVDFLGSPAGFPTGVFRMAAVLRCPVFVMSGLYMGGNRYQLHFDPLIDFSQTDRQQRRQAIVEATQAYASQLEQYCRIAPFNWFNFFDFWAKPETSSTRDRQTP